MTRFPRVFFAVALAALAAPVFGHPGHGAAAGFASGIAHPFAGLDHLLAAMAIGVWAARLGGRATWLLPLTFVSAMLVGGTVGLAGSTGAGVELAIAASVAVLGVMLLLRQRSSLVFAGSIAAFFALFHGIAHAENLTASAAPYLLGVLLATAALHIVGIIAARKLPSLVTAAGATCAIAGAWLMAMLLM